MITTTDQTVTQTDLVQWGEKLREALYTEEAFELVENLWLEGGCYQLAEALKHLIPPAERYGVVRSGSDRVQHMVVLYDDVAFDGDGAQTRPELMRTWREQERMAAPELYPVQDLTVPDSIKAPDSTVEHTINYLRSNLPAPPGIRW